MNEIPAQEGTTLAREESYALRREMIRRLQGSTGGIPRGERSRRLRAFAEGWQELAWRGGLGSLAAILDEQGSASTAGIPAILLLLATRSETEPGSRYVGDDCRKSETDPKALSFQPVRSYGVSGPESQSWWEQGPQGDLFPVGLMVQPL